MTSRDDGALPPRDADVGSLLEVEREVPGLPADVRARVMARARASLSQSVARPARAARMTWRVRFAAAAGLLLAGAGAIAGWQARRNAAPAPEIPARRETAPPSRAVVSSPSPVAPEPVLPTVEPPRPATGRARGDGHADREAELRLIRQAQEAAAGEKFEAALGFLAEHARRFPGGRLVEEREALRIRSLAKSGRVAEARRAAKAFRARFPRSVLLPRIGDLPPE